MEYNFEVDKMLDPRNYDWKQEFSTMAENCRNSNDPVIFLEPGMLMGLCKYTAELEVRQGNRLTYGDWQLKDHRTIDDQVTAIIEELSRNLKIDKQVIGENISHTIYHFLQAGYSTRDTILMVQGIILESKRWCENE